MLEKCGRPDIDVFSHPMNNWQPWQLKKSKPWGPLQDEGLISKLLIQAVKSELNKETL